MAKSIDTSLKSRALLLAAAQAVMEEAGYAAVTSRRVAARAGLKPQLVHYYFASMDDLMVELFRGLAGEILELQAKALKSEQPLHELWQFLPVDAAELAHLGLQALVIARHQQELIALMASLARENGIDSFPWSPEFLAILFNALSRALSIEPSYGLDLGNRESLEALNYFLDRFDRQVPDPAATIKRLEQENAALRATIARLAAKDDGSP